MCGSSPLRENAPRAFFKPCRLQNAKFVKMLSLTDIHFKNSIGNPPSQTYFFQFVHIITRFSLSVNSFVKNTQIFFATIEKTKNTYFFMLFFLFFSQNKGFEGLFPCFASRTRDNRHSLPCVSMLSRVFSCPSNPFCAHEVSRSSKQGSAVNL